MSKATVALAPNAMTTLEDTMERLGIPEEEADQATKIISSGLSMPPPPGWKLSQGATLGRLPTQTDTLAPEPKSWSLGSILSGPWNM